MNRIFYRIHEEGTTFVVLIPDGTSNYIEKIVLMVNSKVKSEEYDRVPASSVEMLHSLGFKRVEENELITADIINKII